VKKEYEMEKVGKVGEIGANSDEVAVSVGFFQPIFWAQKETYLPVHIPL
jgi:hypothetical protein